MAVDVFVLDQHFQISVHRSGGSSFCGGRVGIRLRAHILGRVEESLKVGVGVVLVKGHVVVCRRGMLMAVVVDDLGVDGLVGLVRGRPVLEHGVVAVVPVAGGVRHSVGVSVVQHVAVLVCRREDGYVAGVGVRALARRRARPGQRVHEAGVDVDVAVTVAIVLRHGRLCLAALGVAAAAAEAAGRCCRAGGRAGAPVLPAAAGVRRLAQLLALGAGADHVADRLLDAAPVELFCNGGGGLVDPSVVDGVDVSGNLVLPPRVRNDFLVLEHELVALEELVVGCRAAQPALFGAVCPVGVFAVLEVESYLVEALFANELFALSRSQVSAVYDGVNEPVRMASQVAAGFDAADAFEAEGVPDTTRRHVGFVDEIEDAVRVAQPRGPVDVRLAHESSNATVTRCVGGDEAGVADVAAATRIIGLDEEASETLLGPVLAVQDILRTVDIAHQHDGAKGLEPVVCETVHGKGFHHGIRITALYLAVQLVAQIHQQRSGKLVPRDKGHNRRNGLAIPQCHLAGDNIGGQPGAVRVRERRLAGDPVDGGAGRIVHDGWHFFFFLGGQLPRTPYRVPGESMSIYLRPYRLCWYCLLP